MNMVYFKLVLILILSVSSITADGIDDLINGKGFFPPKQKTNPELYDNGVDKDYCDFPEQPKHGSYLVNENDATYPYIITFFCNPGYDLIGFKKVYCDDRGFWNSSFPECVRNTYCTLPRHNSVHYRCLNNNNSASIYDGYDCEDFLEDGTEVQPKCREPEYHYPGTLKNMHCKAGKWDHVVICSLKTTSISTTSTTTVATTTAKSRTCSLPDFPNNGYYTVSTHPNKTEFFHLIYFCYPGYKIVGTQSLFCINGRWTDKAPKCMSQTQCILSKHSSVQYLCLSRNLYSNYEECDEVVNEGTVVKSVCRENYFPPRVLFNMHCINGEWDTVNFCSPNCGLVTPVGEPLILGGRTVTRGELPWYAGIYRENGNSRLQICGGSLITSTVVISAAHCFWDDFEKKLQPASKYAVAVGKIYRLWNDPRDEDVQKSDVREIKIPPGFLGPATNYQDDIAMVIVQNDFEIRAHIRPICVDFDSNFNRRQLHVNAMGKVAGWGLTKSTNSTESSVLQVVELPYVDIDTCFNESAQAFHEFITSDKICAGVVNGTARAVCKGDSGSGLAFKAIERDSERYYLRGVASTMPSSNLPNSCSEHVYAAFTEVNKHEEFIKEHLIL